MSYWKTSLQQMHQEVDRLRESARSGQTTHLSVFAFALIPLLVALGYALDDTIDADIYSRHRNSDSWHWDSRADAVEFVSRIPDTAGAAEAVVMVNASGTIEPSELPDAVQSLPCIVVEPSGNHAICSQISNATSRSAVCICSLPRQSLWPSASVESGHTTTQLPRPPSTTALTTPTNPPSHSPHRRTSQWNTRPMLRIS